MAHTPRPPRYSDPKMTVEVYERAWAAFQEKQTVEHVRKRVRLSWRTADRIVHGGYPSLGLTALRDRWVRLQEQAQRQADYSLARARSDTVMLIRAYKAKIAQRIKTIEVGDMSTAIGVELDRVARLEEELLRRGAEEEGVSDVFAGWTDAELEAFAATGRWPDSRGVRPADPEGGEGGE